jgi:hypothetical protein
MRILQEAKKEDMPITFLTDLVRKGWEDISYLQGDIEAIDQYFKNTGDLKEILQDLVDAYLICVGRLENHLQGEGIIPENKDDLKGQVKQAVLEEDVQIIINEVPDEKEPEVMMPPPVVPVEVAIAPECDGAEPVPCDSCSEPFEFFTDFDEPDTTDPVVTDDDIYELIQKLNGRAN